MDTYIWAVQLATNLNRWANNQEKRGYFNRTYKAFNGKEREEFMAGFNMAIEYDFEFTNDNF